MSVYRKRCLRMSFLTIFRQLLVPPLQKFLRAPMGVPYFFLNRARFWVNPALGVCHFSRSYCYTVWSSFGVILSSVSLSLCLSVCEAHCACIVPLSLGVVCWKLYHRSFVNTKFMPIFYLLTALQKLSTGLLLYVCRDLLGVRWQSWQSVLGETCSHISLDVCGRQLTPAFWWSEAVWWWSQQRQRMYYAPTTRITTISMNSIFSIDNQSISTCAD